MASRREPIEGSPGGPGSPGAPRGRSFGTLLALSLGASLCAVAALPPAGLWPLAPLVVLLGAWAAIGARSPRALALATLLGWLPAWAWLHRWIVDVSEIGWPALTLYLAACSILPVAILRLLALHGPTRRWPLALLAPLAWTTAEWLRGTLLFDGYPWYLLAHPLAEAPLLVQSADLLGTPLVGAIVAAAGALPLDLTRLRPLSRGARRAAPVAVLLVVGAHLGYGAWRLAETAPLRPGPTVLAIQTNLPVSNKVAWTPESQQRDFLDFGALTLRAMDAAGRADLLPDLVVWPETMFPGPGLEQETIELLEREGFWPGRDFADAIVALAGRLERPLLVGSGAYLHPSLEADRVVFGRIHNSVYLVDPGAPPRRSDKEVMTPFGETMPYISRWPWLERRLLALGASGMRFNLSPGRSEALRIERPTGTWRFAAPICFEDTVAEFVRRIVIADGEPVDLVVNTSNDGWFGAVDDSRRHHVLIARLRCVENRVAMVRSVNTGASVAIDSCGRITAVATIDPAAPRAGGGRIDPEVGPVRESGWLLAQTRLDDRRPLFRLVGATPVWGVAGLTAALAAASIAARRRTRRGQPASSTFGDPTP